MKTKMVLGMFLAVAAFDVMATAPKTIVTGWDLSGLTPDRIVAEAKRLDSLPIDGIAFVLRLREGATEEHTGYMRAAVKKEWPQEPLQRFVPVFREAIKHRSLRYSFVRSMFQPVTRMDWRDDRSWAAFAANMRALAALAKAGGLKGIVLDTEDYWRSSQYQLLPKDGMTYEEAAALARRRGREIFKGVFEEFPDIDILTFWWISWQHEYFGAHDSSAMAKSLGDILPAFTDGVLDVMPDTARLFDGNEHTYHWSHWRNFVSQRMFHPLAVSPENRRKYRDRMWTSSAMYLDMFINPKIKADGTPHPFHWGPVGGRRLNRLLDRYEDAMLTSEDYIWVFGEKRSWLDWGDVKSRKGYDAAYTNGTWETALPGLTEELAILKNPRETLMPRLEAMMRAGDAVNIAEKTADDGKYRRVHEAKGAKYGEWYAICVEAGDSCPRAGTTLYNGKWPCWDRPTSQVIFDAPDKDGRRRGVAFQRIWGDADKIRITASYGLRKTAADDMKVSVYRVFKPGETGGPKHGQR